MHEDDQALVRSIYTALEAIRAELRETQSKTGDHGTQLAVLDVRLQSVEGQLLKLIDRYSIDTRETERLRGGDGVKWAILALAGGGAIGYVAERLFG